MSEGEFFRHGSENVIESRDDSLHLMDESSSSDNQLFKRVVPNANISRQQHFSQGKTLACTALGPERLLQQAGNLLPDSLIIA